MVRIYLLKWDAPNRLPQSVGFFQMGAAAGRITLNTVRVGAGFMKRTLIAGAVIVVAGIAFLAYRFLGEKVSFETVSVSPDGMYRCEVIETQSLGQCKAKIRVFQRSNSVEDPWELLESEEISNDSACRSNYSVDWQYDGRNRTELVTVFGDFGSPPFPGDIIFEMPIAPESRVKAREGLSWASPPRLDRTDSPLEVNLPNGSKMWVLVMKADTPESDDWRWAEEQFLLKAIEGEESWMHRFGSSYGSFAVEIVDLTGNGRPELVLQQGTGRGTSVRSEQLKVLGLRDTLVELKSVPYSGYFGSGAQWWYEHQYVDTDKDGRPEIRLRLEHTPIGEGGAEQPEAIPRDKEVIVDLSSVSCGAPAAGHSKASGLTKAQAVKLVLDLPEVRAWGTFIRAHTNDRVRGAVMVPSEAPDRIGDRDFWVVGFGENQPERFHPWQYFAVNAATGEVFLLGNGRQRFWSLSEWRKKQQPRPTGVSQKLVTRNFEVTLYHLCEEGCVSCNRIVYHGAARKTGREIFLIGKTIHSTGADGVTPSTFRGWEFVNGDVTYRVFQDGTLQVVRRGSQVLVNDKGVWQ